MGAGVRLTGAQWDELDRLRFSTSCAAVFRNCLIVLMSDSRRTIASIAEQLGCCADTVKRVRRLYRKGGAAALVPVKPPGRNSRATPAFVEAMKQAVKAGPHSFGYGFANWSVARLAAHLAKTAGIRFSEDQMRRLMHRHRLSVHRPKHTLKGKRDEAAYGKAGRKLKRLKKKR